METPRFQRRCPWITADLQTVRNVLPGHLPGIPPGSGRRFEIPLSDGSGDRLAARCHEGRSPDLPTIILIHGLTGCENSRHILQSAEAWLNQGAPVIRLNLRGSPPGRSIARDHYHMNRLGDLADACRFVVDLLPRTRQNGIVMIGFSFGGALAMRLACSSFLPEEVNSVVSVSAPLDLEAASRRIGERRNRIYERWLLSRLVNETRPVLQRAPPAVRAGVARARHIRDFDDVLTCREAGFRDALDYYRSCAPLRDIDLLRIPALVIHADDDPWVPPPPAIRHPLLTMKLTRGGGHVGFHGRGSRMPWYNQAAISFVREQAMGRSQTGNRCGEKSPRPAETAFTPDTH